MYYGFNKEDTRKGISAKKVAYIMLCILVLTALYYVFLYCRINYGYAKMKNQIEQSGAVVIFEPHLMNYLFPLIFIFPINLAFTAGFFMMAKHSGSKKIRYKNLIKSIVIVIAINAGCFCFGLGRIQYGYLTENNIILYGSGVNGISKYDVKNIHRVDIELSSGRAGNYAIDYKLNLDNGTDVNLRYFVEYKDLVTVDDVLSKLNVSKSREKLSGSEVSKVSDWLNNYKEDRDYFFKLLGVM